MPIPQLIEEWLLWASWMCDHQKKGIDNPHFLGFDEFLWIGKDFPERAWLAILAIVSDSRSAPFWQLLAAGPMEDLLSDHGENFIDRVEEEARKNPKFANMLGGVWQLEMTEEIWNRVQLAWDRSGWDGIPEKDVNI